MSLGVLLRKRCQCCGHEDDVEVTSGITYNLMPMFRAAGWDHQELDGLTGQQMLPLAIETLRQLEAAPERFEPLNPRNGWGHYTDALWFFKELINVCTDYPEHEVIFCR